MAQRRDTGASDEQRGVAKYVAAQFGVAPRRVLAAMNAYDPNGLGLDAPHKHLALSSDDDDDNDAAGSVAGRTRQYRFSSKQIDAIRRYIRTAIASGKTLTWGQVHKHVVAAFEFAGSVHTLRRRLLDVGIAVLKTTTKPAIDFKAPFWQSQRERFVLQMAEAWEEERAGLAIVIWMDESFVHSHHHRRITVVDTTDTAAVAPQRRAAPKAVLGIGANQGALSIVVHAMSRFGLVVERDAVTGAYKLDAAATAALIYPAGRKPQKSERGKEYYHSHWNGASFVLWLRRQLVKAVAAIFGPTKRMYLVIDNSGNHSARSAADYIPSNARKNRIKQFLVTHCITTLSVKRTVHVPERGHVRESRPRHGRATTQHVAAHDEERAITFTAGEWLQRAPKGPSREELMARVKQLYEENPTYLLPAVERLFAEGVSLCAQLTGTQLRADPSVDVMLHCRLQLVVTLNCPQDLPRVCIASFGRCSTTPNATRSSRSGA